MLKTGMFKKFIILAILFVLVRIFTISEYQNFYYNYGDYVSQFLLAEAAYHNAPSFSVDATLNSAVYNVANKENRYIPLEEWQKYPTSTNYVTFPAVDLPGFAYLITWTSKYFSDHLTSHYAFGIQLIIELFSLLSFVYCISLVFSEPIAFVAGLIYIFAYPFIWPIATQPTRDMFELAVYATPILAFFLFVFKKGNAWWFCSILLLVLTALMLWVRPTGYYYLYLLAPLIFFVKHKSFLQKLTFFGLMILIPFSLFGVPFKLFNLKHYGVADTHVIGRGLWEGLGEIKNNPYGFVFDDSALVPFIKNYYHKDVAYASPEMNQLLGDYAITIIKRDPGYYFATVASRLDKLKWNSLDIVSPEGSHIKRALAIHNFYEKYGSIFFYLAIISMILMFVTQRKKALYLLVLLTPFFYVLLPLLGLQFEQRTLIKAAWVFILPLAWLLVEGAKMVKMGYSKTSNHFHLDDNWIITRQNSIIAIKKRYFLDAGVSIIVIVLLVLNPVIFSPAIFGFKDVFMSKKENLASLNWANAAKNSTLRTAEGIHLVTNNSTGDLQLVAPVLLPHEKLVYMSYTLTINKGGITIGMMNSEGKWITQKNYSQAGVYKNFLVANVTDGKAAIVLANNNSVPSKSDARLNNLDVFVFPK